MSTPKARHLAPAPRDAEHRLGDMRLGPRAPCIQHDTHLRSESSLSMRRYPLGASSGVTGVVAMLHPHHLEDLKKSGLTDGTIEALGFYAAGEQEVMSLLGRARSVGPALVIPYPAACPPHRRVKPDDPPLQWGKRAKYLAPKGAGSRAYIPPQTREAIGKPRKPILITEGEKKAAKADQEGFPCIGIGGVWSFLQGGRLIADLASIDWRRRRVYLVYDSDMRHNRHIRRAALALAWELTGRGALAFVVTLPDGPTGEKVGLDDYLVANGERALHGLLSFDTTALIDTRVKVEGGNWMVEAVKGVDEGRHHRLLGRMAFKLKRDGWPEDAALPILRGVSRKNRPPLPAEDVDALAWLFAKGRPKKYLWGGLWKGRLPIAPSKIEQGRSLLCRLVEKGSVSVKEVMAAAENEGASWETMKRAKKKEGIQSFQQGGIWWWRKPPGRHPSSDRTAG